jgi:glycosyltransferase involved in cell wall biosynthesis
VALLVNFVPPYRVALLEAFQARLATLRVLVSTPMEPNRDWPVRWGGLDVVVQRSFTLKKRWRHPAGFAENGYVHIPYDTVFQLWRYQPDVVISGELGLRTCLAVLYRRLKPAAKFIIWATVSEHSEQNRGWWRESIRRWVLPKADLVMVNGQSGRRYIGRFGVAANRIFTVVPYTAHVGAVTQSGAEEPRRRAERLLYVGQLIPRKGLVPFIAVLSQWARTNPERRVEFRLLGEGPLRSTLQQMNVPPNVSLQLLGSALYDTLPSVYAQADILVLPTLADEWGLVVNEALAAGVPILGSLYSQAVEELVKHRKNGWTFAPDCPDQVYAALDAALQTTGEELQRMRQTARSEALALSPSRIADRLIEAVEWVVRKSC